MPHSKKNVPSAVEALSKLKEVQFFKMYARNDDVIKKIADLCTRKKFRKGSSIIKEGEYGNELFILLSGKIEIVKVTLQGEHYTLSTLDSGMGGVSVGEFALIDNDRRSATVIANTECECLVIKRDDFLEFGDKNPEIGLNITRAIAKQLSTMQRKTNSDVITLFSALVEEIGGSE
jgi:CRP/FNR family transcriptional regulator, cyclic AMP receptor protein